MASGGHIVNDNYIPFDKTSEYSYDANGNLETLERNNGGIFDNLSYTYDAVRPNILNHVDDLSSNPLGAKDQSAGNYTYDKIGNLTQDLASGVDDIQWTLYGKVKSSEYSNGKKVEYTYDAQGNRLSKSLEGKTTYYLRDASGNTLSFYDKDTRQCHDPKHRADLWFFQNWRL